MTTASLRTIVKRALEGETKLARRSKLLLAVSGGPDSMALLDVMADLSPTFAIGIVAHGIDHALRREASRELDLAERHADARAVPFGRTKVVLKPGANVHARAREARWNALAAAAAAAGASAIATAHHADDRAETVLLRLLRGAGARGLGAMPARDRAPARIEVELEVIRPLLRARKSDVLAHLKRRKVPFASDPSNADPRFLRARVRHELLPLLTELSPGIVEHLVAVADELADERGASGRPDEHIGDGSRDWAIGLPRRTREALRVLEQSRSTSARVWLPGGLVVSIARNGRTRPRSKGAKVTLP